VTRRFHMIKHQPFPNGFYTTQKELGLNLHEDRPEDDNHKDSAHDVFRIFFSHGSAIFTMFLLVRGEMYWCRDKSRVARCAGGDTCSLYGPTSVQVVDIILHRRPATVA